MYNRFYPLLPPDAWLWVPDEACVQQLFQGYHEVKCWPDSWVSFQWTHRQWMGYGIPWRILSSGIWWWFPYRLSGFFSMKKWVRNLLVDQAISRAVNGDLVTQLVISSLSPLYTITSQSLNNCSFSIHLSCMEEKFSWCAPPMLVRIPMVGWIIGVMLPSHPFQEIPASKFLIPCVHSSAIRKEAPDLWSYSFLENGMEWSGLSIWYNHSFTTVFPLLPVIPMTGTWNCSLCLDARRCKVFQRVGYNQEISICIWWGCFRYFVDNEITYPFW